MQTVEINVGSGRTVALIQGDITKVPVDAIVNAANAELIGGGGVDGAIHRAGGPSIMRELDVIRAECGGCQTGNAVCTSAGNLPARFVFHAVGPIYRGGRHGEAEALASCYRICLSMAEQRGCAAVSFPAISAGVYGYPLAEAAEIAVREACLYLTAAEESTVQAVYFVLFDQRTFDAFAAALASRRIS